MGNLKYLLIKCFHTNMWTGKNQSTDVYLLDGERRFALFVYYSQHSMIEILCVYSKSSLCEVWGHNLKG